MRKQKDSDRARRERADVGTNEPGADYRCRDDDVRDCDSGETGSDCDTVTVTVGPDRCEVCSKMIWREG